MDNLFIDYDLGILIEMIVSIYKDYRSGVDTLMESIALLAEEITLLQETTPHPNAPTSIPFPLANMKA